MEHYWVEGLFVTRRGLKKSRKGSQFSQADMELFARLLWADSVEEAILLATQALNGGQWVETPKVSRKSEEQRMRLRGAPELPGLNPKPGFNPMKKKR
jgi:hypothetical protein